MVARDKQRKDSLARQHARDLDSLAGPPIGEISNKQKEIIIGSIEIVRVER
jgi:hypothetical protein